ncbi:YozQ family protein [Bacillus sp. CGMCC 1.16607]|uniref:YozQ family protein n=1 Tax=Bacillus sp. CGMCC 1.16607 TaxID=3351842 RepID=UPI003636EF15
MDKNNKNLNLAGRNYQVDDYKKENELSSGLATTHEQVSDSYMEGESFSLVGDINGKNVSIPLDDDSENK